MPHKICIKSLGIYRLGKDAYGVTVFVAGHITRGRLVFPMYQGQEEGILGKEGIWNLETGFSFLRIVIHSVAFHLGNWGIEFFPRLSEFLGSPVQTGCPVFRCGIRIGDHPNIPTFHFHVHHVFRSFSHSLSGPHLFR